MKNNKKIICPKCKQNIKTMKNLKKIGCTYICKCGENVTKLKLNQLIDMIKNS